MRARTLSAILFSSAVVSVSASAFAANPETTAEAARLFDEGRRLVSAKKYDEACPKFAESLRLESGIGTRLYLADCYEKNGQKAGAWVHFREAARAAAAKHDERESVAVRRAREIEAELTRLVIALPVDRRVPGVEVRRDGVVVSPEEIGTAFPIDPGVHTVSASAPGREPWSVSIQIGTLPIATTVNVPLLAAAEAAAAAAAPAAPPPPSPAPTANDVDTTPTPNKSSSLPPSTTSAMSAVRIAGISVGALGVATLAIGGFLGLNAKSTYDRANDNGHCNAQNQCDPTGREARADASGLAMASTIAVTGGVALIATGVILFVTGGSKPASSATTARTTIVTPSNVSQGRGAQLVFEHRF